MARHKLTIAQKWQIIGMRNSGLSLRRIAENFEVNFSVISRLLKRHREDGTVEERPRSGRPRKTTIREDRTLSRSVTRYPFRTARWLRDDWNTPNRVSVRTVNRRLNSARLRARRPIKRPALTRRHRVERYQWAQRHRHWNIRSWRRIHWSDESRFLLRHVDGRMRVWRRRNMAYDQRNIVGTTAFGGGGVTVWGCFSYDCKLDLHVLQGNMTGLKYRDNVIRNIILPHFDNHALADRPIFMDDNARPHRARIVADFIQQEAIETFPWPAMSPDMNPIKHLWDIIGRKLNERVPACQNLAELRAAIVNEWDRLPRDTYRHLVQGMRRRVMELVRKRGGYTHY